MTGQADRPLHLNYVIANPRGPITLDVYDAERYESAVIVQSLVGTLVHYSNRGMYEPRLAKNWTRTDPHTWEFNLYSDLKCEDGEAINPTTLKRSLERTLRYLSAQGEIPILSGLVGYQEFLDDATSLAGIEAEGSTIRFRFARTIRDGVLGVLSFPQFGYIASDNVEGGGRWKAPSRFVSSGPYRVESIKIGERYDLARNPFWTIPFANNSPEKISFTHDAPSRIDPSEYWVLDGTEPSAELSEHMQGYDLHPEYLNSVLLGGSEGGYFTSLENRQRFKALFDQQKARLLPEKFRGHIRATGFFPDGKGASLRCKPMPPALYPLIIEGIEPTGDSPRAIAWQVLKATLDDAHLEYTFANNDGTTETMSDQSYDIRIRGSALGSTVEPWGIGMVFYSPLGIRFPDPSGKVFVALTDFESEAINENEFAKRILNHVDQDAAILPVSHYGRRLFFSNNICTSSLDPKLTVIRFDQWEMAHNGG